MEGIRRFRPLRRSPLPYYGVPGTARRQGVRTRWRPSRALPGSPPSRAPGGRPPQGPTVAPEDLRPDPERICKREASAAGQQAPRRLTTSPTSPHTGRNTRHPTQAPGRGLSEEDSRPNPGGGRGALEDPHGDGQRRSGSGEGRTREKSLACVAIMAPCEGARSVARPDAAEHSDVDLIVEVEPGRSPAGPWALAGPAVALGAVGWTRRATTVSRAAFDGTCSGRPSGSERSGGASQRQPWK